MLKPVRVPQSLIALSAVQRAAGREVGAPLYLPAYEERLLQARAELEDEDDRPVEAGGITIGDDDDFY